MSDMSTVLQNAHWATRTNATLLAVATVAMVWVTWRLARRVDRATDRVVKAVATQKLSQLADLIPAEDKEMTRWPDVPHR